MPPTITATAAARASASGTLALSKASYSSVSIAGMVITGLFPIYAFSLELRKPLRPRASVTDGRPRSDAAVSVPGACPGLVRPQRELGRLKNDRRDHAASLFEWSKSEGSKFEQADLPISALYGEARR
jgi:hypothetical protein